MARAEKKDGMSGHTGSTLSDASKKGKKGEACMAWLLIASWWGVSVLSHSRFFLKPT